MENSELQLAYDFVKYTNRNLFLTGRAGTGKTTFLHTLRKESPKRMIVVAPTGVAAINAGGVTMHSFFQLPFGPVLPGHRIQRQQEKENEFPGRKFSRQKREIIRTLDLLVIDEISMVRADMLDGVDEVLRRFRNPKLPFGGVQLVMIGDLQQLPPVVKQDEWEILRTAYSTPYFFGSHALARTNYVTVELQHVYRQSDARFIRILNEVRDQKLSPASVELLNQRYRPGYTDDRNEGYVILTTHNAPAQEINLSKLQKLRGKEYVFKARVEGDFPQQMYPTDARLSLKKGAQVMFLKNDPSPEKLYFNGKIGVVEEIDDQSVFVLCDGDPDAIEVKPAVWENISYSIDEKTKEIQERVLGTFTQYPLKLAWAVTIHKSQGLTFDKVIIDARAAFAHGQVYVALSRCRSLEGIVLSSKLPAHSFRSIPELVAFHEEMTCRMPDDAILREAKQEYLRQLLDELFDFSGMANALTDLKLLITENRNTVIKPDEAETSLLQDRFLKEVLSVAGRFGQQIDQLLEAGDEPMIRERTAKASVFFAAKLDELFSGAGEVFLIDTDNKEVRKKLQETRGEIMMLLRQKKECLQACSEGFDISRYLRAKAVAALRTEKEDGIGDTIREKTTDSGTGHPELYERIKQWRNMQALNSDVPVFRVLPLGVIRKIAGQLPLTKEALQEIKGIGKRKAEAYGEEILEIVRKYCEEKNIAGWTPEPEKKKERIASHRITADLWRSGKSVAEIASERGLSVTTVEGHLAQNIREGEIGIEGLVPEEKIRQIEECFRRKGNYQLKPVKDELGDRVSWGELRMVAAFLEQRKAQNDE